MNELWVYLAESPLFWLTSSIGIFWTMQWVFIRLKQQPLANPVLWTIVILSGLLIVTDTSYEAYFDGAQFIHFLLGPATVALAIPLFHQFDKVRQSAKAMSIIFPVGCVVAILFAMGTAAIFDASESSLISLSPKAITTPIAMGVSEKLGGVPALTAVFVILTGIVGAVFASTIFKVLKITDHRAMGLALGLPSHGLGTARAFQISETAGAFAGMSIGLNGLLTAFILPMILPILLGFFA